MSTPRPLTRIEIVRLGLVQAALGSIVVLATSTLNRVMVVELALPAAVPGALVALHYAMQVLRPRFGYGADSGARTPWIVGGMTILAAGGTLAAFATATMRLHFVPGLALAIFAFTLIGVGVGACGTSLLVLLATRVEDHRRGAAATCVWIMMIMGFAATAGIAGHWLDPFSMTRLIGVTATICATALIVTTLALWRIERPREPAYATHAPAHHGTHAGFRAALADVWAEPNARRFALFVFVSMLAYGAQDLILDPFAGRVFGLSPGASTKLSGLLHGGVLGGMILVGFASATALGRRIGTLQSWAVRGCVASALGLLVLAAGGAIGRAFPLRGAIFCLGIANGVYAVAAIGSMMALVNAGRPAREGVRMGLWGAAQAIAFGLGGFMGSFVTDVARHVFGSAVDAYASVFIAQALMFLAAAAVATRVGRTTVPASAARFCGRRWRRKSKMSETFDAVVIGGGPAGATAADDLAMRGHSVLLLDRAGRIKPCGGAIPPRLIKQFTIPDELIVARIKSARIVAPSTKKVDMPIEGGFVGMVDRAHFDEWLRERAAANGAKRLTGRFETVTRDDDGMARVHFIARSDEDESPSSVRARVVIGADGARSAVARQCIPGADQIRYVFAYHEIVQSPPSATKEFSGTRCDVYYQGALSPDFYGWIFPHGETTSVGMGTACKGFGVRNAVGALRKAAQLDRAQTIRREGAPIPLTPLKRWDNGRDIIVVGDAAGLVAPASGEGIYYAMLGARFAAEAAATFLATGDVRALATARRRFMRMHGGVFWILGIMQRFWYASDARRERFVSICRDRDVQQLTWDAYMNKELVRAKPIAHVRIFFKNIAHLAGLVAS